MAKVKSHQVFSYVVALVGVLLLLTHLPNNISTILLVGFILVTAVGESNTIYLSTGHVSPIQVIVLYTYFVLGVNAALWIVVLASLVRYFSEHYLLGRKREIHLHIFNSFQYATAILLAHYVLPILDLIVVWLPSILLMPLRAISFGVCFMLVNHTMVNLHIWLETGQVQRQTILETLRWDLCIYGFSLVFAIPMIQFSQYWGNWSFVLFYMPLLAVGRGFRSYHEYAVAHKELTMLYEVSATLGRSLQVNDVLQHIVVAAQQLVNADLICIYSVDEVLNTYQLETADGAYASSVEQGQAYAINEGLSGMAIANKQPILVWGSENLACYPDQYSAFEAALCVPALYRDHVWGCITLNARRREAFRSNDIRLIKMLARYAAVSVFNADTFIQERRKTITDNLTGLYNFYHFSIRLDDAVQASCRANEEVSLIMADIDSFKAVNDQFGHLIGNKVLSHLAKVLRKNVRQSDVVARFGGEEFAIILPSTTKQVAVDIAERVRKAVAFSVLKLDEQNITIRITISMGVATYPLDATNKHELIDAADQALYKDAKQKGKNRVGVAS